MTTEAERKMKNALERIIRNAELAKKAMWVTRADAIEHIMRLARYAEEALLDSDDAPNEEFLKHYRDVRGAIKCLENGSPLGPTARYLICYLKDHSGEVAESLMPDQDAI